METLSERRKRILREFQEDEAEARKIREEEAGWEYINRQPPNIKETLIAFIRCGDLYVASIIAQMTINEFNEFRIKAKIPVVS